MKKELDNNNFVGEYKTKFKVYKTGAVSIANVKYGPSTHVARCLSGIARELTLEDKEKKAAVTDAVSLKNMQDDAENDRMGILMDAKDKLMDGCTVTDAVLYVKHKYNLNEILTGDIEEALRKKTYLNNIDDTEILLEAKDKLSDGWQVADAVAFVKDKYNLSKPQATVVETTLRNHGIF